MKSTLSQITAQTIKAAQFERADFSDIHGHKLTFKGVEYDVDAFIKERVKNYMNSYVVGRLEDIKDVLDGRKTANAVKFWLR